MNRDDIIRIAEQAGASRLANVTGFTDFLARFAALAYEAGAASEREACAKVADEADKYNRHISREIANAIRARGNK